MIVNADSRFVPLADSSVQCVVTSPPYYGLRDYGVSGQIGLEQTPEQYIENIVNVSREVWRVLKADGVYWLNIGDSYAANRGYQVPDTNIIGGARDSGGRSMKAADYGLKPKDLMMIPARVAIALQSDGWYLRAEIIWAKPNPMPESVTDRPTRSHEVVYLLAKRERYYYDADAVKEKLSSPENLKRTSKNGMENGELASGKRFGSDLGGRNLRDVWTMATEPYSGAHYATFPTEIPRRAIKAGSRPNDIILDPFCGSGTTGQVARELGRRFIGLDLSMKYLLENALPRAERKTAAHVIAALPLFAPEAA